MTTSAVWTRPKVFISYSRQDCSELAEELVTGLELLSFEGYIDRHDIAGGEDWELRLEALIRQADTVLFLLSPSSVKSDKCAWEVKKATSLSKRVVPVVAIAVQDELVPETLRRINYIYFTQGRSFSGALGQLADALRLDLDWIREHTRLGELARRWRERGAGDALLLRDTELAGAQAWLAKWQPGAPEITEEHRSFIAASGEAEAKRNSEERQRNEQIALANAKSSLALAERENALKSLRRRTLIGGTAAVGMSVAIGGLAYRATVAQRSADNLTELSGINSLLGRDRTQKEASLRTDLEGQMLAYAASPARVSVRGVHGDEASSPFTQSARSELDLFRARSLQDALLGATCVEPQRRHRGFFSSDMNGQIYLYAHPPSRQLRALVVAVEDIGGMTSLLGVRNDALHWLELFKENGFDVQSLVNPKRNDMLAAIEDMRFTAVVGPTVPSGNSLGIVYFSGLGHQEGEARYISFAGTGDSASPTNTGNVARSSSISIDEIARILRERAAASCLILDTRFT